MQGVFLDTDGTLLNSQTVPQELADQAGFPIGVPGTTWHSAVDNDMFRDMPEVRQGLVCLDAFLVHTWSPHPSCQAGELHMHLDTQIA